MDPIQTLTRAMDAVAKAVDHRDHEPDPARADWPRLRNHVTELRRRMEDEVIASFATLAIELPPGAREKVADNVAFLAIELSAIVRASADESGAVRLLRAAHKLGPRGLVAEELEGAMREPATHLALCRARWNHRQGDFDVGDRILREARRTAKDAGLRKLIETVLNGSRPLTNGAPALFRVNGFGVGIYGERDRRDDGSYVTTHCISALFVPIFPLGAYRVIDQGHGSYLFLSKEPLSAFARGWRWALLAAVVLGVVSTAVSSYLSSPSRLAAIALEDARAVDARGDVDASLAAYDGLLAGAGYDLDLADREAVGVRYVDVLASTVPTPLTEDRLDAFDRAMTRWQSVPQYARSGAPERHLQERVAAWASELGERDERSLRAALTVVERGIAVTTPSSPLDARRSALHRALGERLAPEWPFEALDEHVASGLDEAGVRAAAPIVERVIASPSLVLAASRSLRAWASAARMDTLPLRDRVSDALAAADAMQADAERAAALASGDEALLRASLARFPDDHDCVAALADLSRARGDSAAATATLRALGSPGVLAPTALASLAAAELDVGHLDDARALLARRVMPRLGELREAQQAMSRIERERTESLVSRLEMGLGPPEVQARLRVASDDETRAIVSEHLASELSRDPELGAARARYEAIAPIVPSVLQLAMIELRRGGERSGAERDRALADAERLFLAIQAEAASVPAYHLGLGQVYYRLGREGQGEQELQSVLASGDEDLALQVARAYRELGLEPRAREVATGVYERGQQPQAGRAAMLLSILADRIEDTETWLARAPQDTPEVRTRLTDVRGQRALRERRYDDADRLFAEVARDWDRAGDRDMPALNNAAVALGARYEATADPSHLDAALDRLERAVRLAPDQSITISNLADAHRFRGTLRVLSRWLDGRALRLDRSQADALLGIMTAGAHRAEVIAALRDDPGIRRAIELTHQEQVLAPRRAGAWERELALLRRCGDPSALVDLEARIARVGELEVNEQRAAWERGEWDAEILVHAERALADADDRLARARRGRDPRAVAALLTIRGNALLERATVRAESRDADVDLAIAAYREAAAAWPELGASSMLAQAHVTRALLRDASLRVRWEAERRRFSVVAILHHASNDPAQAAQVRASSDVRDAVAALSALDPVVLRVDELWIAESAADAAMIARLAPVRAREDLRAAYAIDRRLDPSDSESDERLATLASR
ncbi:hypothetical protein [Sandaracinus amylolyticus]|uniref:Methyltransferase type 11 n=1 Tax=Sandaracinus amylolyticus TaxID=927083 RepID=A0A0F6YJZ3_9BACT|nr:hypothetical protein [Sandaracinus amylolyticus]AKF06753.1 Methyltransferase type 11 [Sandaracinus amylolyticus]